MEGCTKDGARMESVPDPEEAVRFTPDYTSYKPSDIPVGVVRKKLGWSQARMAHFLGYSLRHYQSCEGGHRALTNRTVMLIEIVSLLCDIRDAIAYWSRYP